MVNKYTGEVSVQIGGKTAILVYDWRAYAEVQSTFGLDKIKDIFAQSPDDIATILEIGFRKKNPEITKDVILEDSPIIMTVCRAIDRAFLYAQWGPEDAEKILADMDKVEKSMKEAIEKKTQ